MNKILKLVIGVVAAVLALFVVATIVVSFIDANRFRPQIEARVRQATGRQLQIGDIHLSLFPVIGARLRKVELANAPGFGDQPQFSVGEVDVGVRLLPLILHRRIEAGQVVLSDAEINLAVDAQGHNNWSDLGGKPPSAQASTPSAGGESAAAPMAIAIGGIDIRNAALHYSDRKAGKQYAIDALNLKTGAIDVGKPFDLKLDFHTQLSDPAVSAKVSAAGTVRVDPASKQYGVDALALQVSADGGALPNGHLALSLKGDVDGGPDRVDVKNLTLKLDDTTVAGNVALTSLKNLAATFALTVDQIDLDHYFPPKKAEAATQPGAASEKSKSSGETRIPVAALDALSLDGTLQIGRLKSQNVTVTDVHLDVHAPRGSQKTLQLNGRLYNGTLASTTRIVPGSTPRYAETAKLQAVDVGALVKDYLGKDKLAGIGGVDLQLDSSGPTVSDLKRALNGELSFALKNAAVKGFNLAQIIRRAQALAEGQTLQQSAAQAAAQQTDFSDISGGGRFVNGVLHADRLDGHSPLFRLSGAGTIDLVRESIDYIAQPTVVNTTTGQGGRELADLNGITVPVHVTGSFADPHYSVDLKTAVKQKAVQKLTEKLEQKNPGLANTLQNLGGLFGRKPKETPPASGNDAKPTTN